MNVDDKIEMEFKKLHLGNVIHSSEAMEELKEELSKFYDFGQRRTRSHSIPFTHFYPIILFASTAYQTSPFLLSNFSTRYYY